MDFLRLVKIELHRLLLELRHYRLDQMIGLLDAFLICLGIFTGTGRDLFPGGTLFYALVGMVLWRAASIGLQTACGIVQKEIRLGTLEQLLLTRHSFGQILIARVLSRLMVEMVKLGALSVLIGWIFGIRPEEGLSPAVLAVSLALFLAGTVGMGCLIAGLALLYKKANALVNAVSYFMLFFTGAVIPLEAVPEGFARIARCLPFCWCLEAMQSASFGQGMAGLLATASVWLLLGLGFFQAALDRMSRKGSTARY